jgi:hypothetical protein
VQEAWSHMVARYTVHLAVLSSGTVLALSFLFTVAPFES